MKRKSNFLAAAVALSALFVSCDEENLKSIIEDAMGKAQFTVERGEASVFGDTYTAHNPGDTISFSSVLADALDGDITVEGETVHVKGLAALGSGSKLNSNSSMVAFPFFGVKLKDVEAGVYNVQSSLNDSEFVNALNNQWQSLLANSDINAFLMAEAIGGDTVVYLGVGGSITINEVPEYGEKLTGTLNNVEARVVTFSNLTMVKQLIRRYAADPEDEEVQRWIDLLSNNNFEPFFPKVTLNGTFESTRANVLKLVEKMQNN